MIPAPVEAVKNINSAAADRSKGEERERREGMITRESFGADGRGNDVELFTLTNTSGTQVKISTLGAAVVSFLFRDKTGTMRDVVLGYDNPAAYLENKGLYFGATVGRCANRIANAKVTISGIEYTLEANSDANNLHSGSNGVSHKIWETESIDEEKNALTLKILSRDMEQGFPGNMTIKLTFTLGEDHALKIAYEAVSDKDTVANMTNHSYFNLAGDDAGYIGSQKLKLYADSFTPLAPAGSIPTGEIRPVEKTPMDFREWKEIGQEIDSDYDQIVYAKGYDHNFVLDNQGELKLMAEALCEDTGIHLYAYTDCPGVQLYTGNFIHEHKGKNGAVYGERHGFCLESQYVPDSVNNPAFAAPFLKAGEAYASVTVYKLALN